MRKQIAIVDDDHAVRESLAAVLESAGYAVRLFAVGDDFLRSRSANDFDLIILDHQMRGLTGVEIAERLLEVGSNVPIVMITGNMADPMYRRAREAGVSAILEKPFSDESLTAAIETLVPGLGQTQRG